MPSRMRRKPGAPVSKWDGRPFAIEYLESFLTPYCISKIVLLDRGCWLWTGSLNSRGYSTIRYQGKMWTGHRLTCHLFGVDIPDGKRGDHQCHTSDCGLGDDCPHRACIYPAHILPATDLENYLRGYRIASQKALTHCKWGHEFTPENTYITPDGRRRCRECAKNKMRRYRELGMV